SVIGQGGPTAARRELGGVGEAAELTGDQSCDQILTEGRMQELVGLQMGVVPGSLCFVDEEEPAYRYLSGAELRTQPGWGSLWIYRAEQCVQVGVEFGFTHPLAAAAEHSERHHRQAQQFPLDSVCELCGRQGRAGLADLPLGEAGQQPLIQLSLPK